jgi:alpha-glucosidase
MQIIRQKPEGDPLMAYMKFHPVSFLSLIFILSASVTGVAQDKTYQVKSPDGRSELRLNATDKLAISVLHNGQEIISPSTIAMELNDLTVLGNRPVVVSATPASVKSSIVPIIPEKRKLIPDIYNELTLTFKGNYGLKARAYDDGVAYRFFTAIKRDIIVSNV